MSVPVDILLIDDNAADAELIADTMELDGFVNRVVWQRGGAEALAYLRGDAGGAECARPGLILLDINMPGLDGRQVLEAIRGDERLATIPVAVLMGSMVERAVHADLPADCFVTKPVGREQLDAIAAAVARLSIEGERDGDDVWLAETEPA